MKKNLIFFGKMAVVLALTIGLLIPINLLYKSGETYQGTYAGMEKYESVPTGIEYANFGPSYGMNCFDYEALTEEGKTCFNFSLTMQDLYHDYMLYKAYEDHFASGAVVAITVSYFSFCSDTESPSSARYYKLLDDDVIKGYTIENDLSANYFPVYGKGGSLVRDLTNDILNGIMKKSMTSSEETDNENTVLSGETAGEKAKELKEDSAVRVMTIESGNMKTFDHCIDKNVLLLKDWIKEMQAKGLKPIVVLTPYWNDYTEGFDDALLKATFTDPCLSVVEETGVPYMNCKDPVLYGDYINTPAYFNNCDHVSTEGAKAFMERFLLFLKNE